MADQSILNKVVVARFNQEVLACGNEQALAEILDEEFVNRTAMAGVDAGFEGMRQVISEVLHKGLSEIRVEILDQVAEGDTVATRKRISGKHTGDYLGASATGRDVEIIVFDFVRLRNGKYLEHCGLNTIPLLVQSLKTQ